MDNTLDAERKIDVVVIEWDKKRIALAVECKNYRRLVEIGDIEKWKTQCDDMGIAHRIFVSSSGYQDGAIKKAEAHGIMLLRWEAHGIMLLRWEYDSVICPEWFCNCDYVFIEDRKVQPLRAEIDVGKKCGDFNVIVGEKIFLIDGNKWSINEVAINAVSKEKRKPSDVNSDYFEREINVEFPKGASICKKGKLLGMTVKSMQILVRVHEFPSQVPLKVEAVRFNNLPEKVVFAFIADKTYQFEGKEYKASILVSEVTNQKNRFIRAEWLPA